MLRRQGLRAAPISTSPPLRNQAEGVLHQQDDRQVDSRLLQQANAQEKQAAAVAALPLQVHFLVANNPLWI